MKPLFDEEVQRTRRFAGYSESTFAFLNRSAWTRSARVRAELQRWFDAYPASGQPDLRGRLRSPDPGQHLGAWWELYLHHLFVSLGFSLEDHPDITGTSKHADFRVTAPDGSSFLLEAVTTRSGIVRDEDRHKQRENELMDIIDSVKSTSFSVTISLTVGPAPLKAKEVRKAVRDWLDGLDPSDPRWERNTIPEHRFVLERDGWAIELTPFRLNDWNDPQPDDDDRLIGGGPGLAGPVDDSSKLAAALESKRKRYGRDLGEPYVVAALCEALSLEDYDVLNALLGHTAIRFTPGVPGSAREAREPDGMWLRGSDTVGDHVSAVLILSNLFPWSVTRELPVLWPNPWASRPTLPDLPFERAVISPDDLRTATHEPAKRTAADVLQLPADWPGREDE